MRNSILGFNQEQLINYDVDMNEVLLLDYAYNAVASPTMEHIFENGICYVWLNHSRILEDLPILNIGEDRLKRVLKHLVDAELLSTVRHNNTNLRGSKSYYTITEKCEELRYSHNDQVLKTTRGQVRPSVVFNTSYNKLNNKKDNNTISKDIVENSRLIPKPNLYSKCVALIHDYTTNDELSKALIEYLKVRLEMKDKPLYVNSWKGLLNKLDREFDEHERLSVVYQSIERGYASFFPVNISKSNNTARDIEHLTESNPRGNKEKLKEDIANGNVTRF